MNKLKIWFLAARPKTLAAGIAPVLMGGALAVKFHVFHTSFFLAALCGALLIQIATNFANDYYDFKKGADTAVRKGPARATQSGWITPSTMFRAAILTFSLAGLIALFLTLRGGWPILVIGILSILCGVLYTAGPYALGYIGLADLFVLIFFGPVACAGTFYVQALWTSPYIIAAGFIPGFLSVGILTVNNLRDMHEDRAAHKKTLAVRFGSRFAQLEFIITLILAWAMMFTLFLKIHQPWRAILLSFVFFVFIPPLRHVMQHTHAQLNNTLAQTGLGLLLLSTACSMAWIIP